MPDFAQRDLFTHQRRFFSAAEQAKSGFAQRDRLRCLVLEARKIPFVYLPQSGRIFVPPLLWNIAAAEIAAFESERGRRELWPEDPGRVRNNWPGVLLLLCPLLGWDAVRHAAFFGRQLYFLPADPATWVQLGGLKAQALTSGEWWRVFTALTLHGDAAHVLGNCLFGVLFLLPLCRRLGLGAGFWLAIWGGALGNAVNTLFQGPGVTSLGFSSAVFAALGALCAVTAWDKFMEQRGAQFERLHMEKDGAASSLRNQTQQALWSKAAGKSLFLCMAAGLAFLAFLGGSGEPGIDFSAHVLGFLGGLALALILTGLDGLLARTRCGASSLKHSRRNVPSRLFLFRRSRTDLSKQIIMLLLAFGLPVLGWYLALTN